MTKVENGGWVLVADGEKALFLRNTSKSRALSLEIVRKEAQDNPKTAEQGTDRPGRAGGGAYQPTAIETTDWHALAKERFAEDLADLLYRQAHRGRFSQIALVAPPTILGALRDRLHKEVADRVVAEIPKTLTNHPVAEIARLVTAALED